MASGLYARLIETGDLVRHEVLDTPSPEERLSSSRSASTASVAVPLARALLTVIATRLFCAGVIALLLYRTARLN